MDGTIKVMACHGRMRYETTSRKNLDGQHGEGTKENTKYAIDERRGRLVRREIKLTSEIF